MPVSRTTTDILNADATQVIYKNAQLDGGFAQSGSLTQPTFVSGTAQALSTTRNVWAYIAVTNTAAGGTATIALSPDNSTFTNLAVVTSTVNASVHLATVMVPAGWFLKITLSNATVVVTTA